MRRISPAIVSYATHFAVLAAGCSKAVPGPASAPAPVAVPAPSASPPAETTAMPTPSTSASTSFADDVAFLSRYAPVKVLESPQGGRVAISGAYQGRVMTSAVEANGRS